MEINELFWWAFFGLLKACGWMLYMLYKQREEIKALKSAAKEQSAPVIYVNGCPPSNEAQTEVDYEKIEDNIYKKVKSDLQAEQKKEAEQKLKQTQKLQALLLNIQDVVDAATETDKPIEKEALQKQEVKTTHQPAMPQQKTVREPVYHGHSPNKKIIKLKNSCKELDEIGSTAEFFQPTDESKFTVLLVPSREVRDKFSLLGKICLELPHFSAHASASEINAAVKQYHGSNAADIYGAIEEALENARRQGVRCIKITSNPSQLMSAMIKIAKNYKAKKSEIDTKRSYETSAAARVFEPKNKNRIGVVLALTGAISGVAGVFGGIYLALPDFSINTNAVAIHNSVKWYHGKHAENLVPYINKSIHAAKKSGVRCIQIENTESQLAETLTKIINNHEIESNKKRASRA